MPEETTPALPDQTGVAAATEALQRAFSRLAPQGSHAWNFGAAFAVLDQRFGPAPPGPSDAGTPAAPEPSWAPWRRRRSRRRPVPGVTAAGPDHASGVTGLDEAMVHVVEAFRFLSARVEALEARQRMVDYPLEGGAWLAAADELDGWVDPVVAYVTSTSPGGLVLHGDCGQGVLLGALAAAGLEVRGVEPRGSVGLVGLERGLSVVLAEVDDVLADHPPATLGGLVLSGVVDRLPVHRTVALLERARMTLALGSPLVIVARDPSQDADPWAPPAREILASQLRHAETWELLVRRAGFAPPCRLEGGPVGDGRVALAALCPP